MKQIAGRCAKHVDLSKLVQSAPLPELTQRLMLFAQVLAYLEMVEQEGARIARRCDDAGLLTVGNQLRSDFAGRARDRLREIESAGANGL